MTSVSVGAGILGLDLPKRNDMVLVAVSAHSRFNEDGADHVDDEEVRMTL